ncbi:hypothetical protein U1Q18_004150 [Sarracenia purpurea var. burkii]
MWIPIENTQFGCTLQRLILLSMVHGEGLFNILINVDVVFQDVDIVGISGDLYTALVITAESKTVPDEVKALQTLKSAMGLPLRFGWNGDPCVPQQHPWTGADCQSDKTINGHAAGIVFPVGAGIAIWIPPGTSVSHPRPTGDPMVDILADSSEVKPPLGKEFHDAAVSIHEEHVG